jgi:hypothetical protein
VSLRGGVVRANPESASERSAPPHAIDDDVDDDYSEEDGCVSNVVVGLKLLVCLFVSCFSFFLEPEN